MSATQTEIAETKATKSDNGRAKGRTQELGTLMLDVSKVHVREGFNVRKVFEPGKLKELAEAIERVGQIDAISVVDAPDKGEGHYYLVQGERRLRAIRDLLKRPQIRATIFMADKAQAINVGGNRDREGVRHWERCEAISDALKRGEDRKDIMAQWRISSPTVTNDRNLREKLSPKCWEAFKRDDTLGNLFLSIYNLTHEEQDKKLGEYLEARKVREADTTKAGKARKRRRKAKGGGSAGPDAAERAAFVAGILAALRAGKVKGASEASYLRGLAYAARYLTGEKVPRDEGMPVYIRKAIEAAAKAEADGADDGADD